MRHSDQKENMHFLFQNMYLHNMYNKLLLICCHYQLHEKYFREENGRTGQRDYSSRQGRADLNREIRHFWSELLCF